MSPRDIAAPVATAFGAAVVNIAWLLRLDIDQDPVYAWTGLGPLVIPPGTYTDTRLNGITFEGLANIGEIGKISDGVQGSQAVRLSLPGIQLTDDALRQIVYDQRKWQGLPGYLWVVPLTDAGALWGQPVRAKTGRMDNLKVEKRKGTGLVRIDLESFNSYSQQGLMTRYSEQKELDATDTSQTWVHDLANKLAGIGDKANATANVVNTFAQDTLKWMIPNAKFR